MERQTAWGWFRRSVLFKPLVVTVLEVVAIMALLPDLPIVGPAVAPRAHAQTQTIIVVDTGLTLNPYGPIDINPPDPDPIVIADPCRPITGQIIQKLCSYVIPPGSLEVFINATPPHKALQQFESDTAATFLKQHQISPADVPLIYQSGDAEMRTEVRNLMLSRIRKMNGDPANAMERAAYDWFKYQMWLFERAMYEVAIAERSAWQSNPCTWKPEPDLAEGYGLQYDGAPFCENNNLLAGLLGDPPIVPSKAYFLGFAQKKVYGKALENQDKGAAALARMILTSGVGAGFAALAGGGLGLGIGLGAKQIWSQSAGYSGQGRKKKNIRPANIRGFLRIGIPGPTMIVTLMIQAGVEMGFRVFEYESVMKELKTLDTDLANIKAGPSELSRYNDDNGVFKMNQVFAALTQPDVAGAAPLPSHNPLTDPAFYLTPSNTYSDALT
jgi:hypothetical protein